MNDTIPIPPADALGIPSHPVIFQFLAILTFFLHVVFMNFILGGSLIVAINEWILAGKEQAIRANTMMVKCMPVALSMAITMGVAPLLFVQVLYGQFFYTSNIIMGWRWFMILLLVTVGFYLLYIMIAKRPEAHRSTMLTKVISLVNVILFFLVAFIFTNNAILTENPQYWTELYVDQSFKFVPDPTLVWRYLHNVLAAIAVAGVWCALIGRYQTNRHPENAALGKYMEKTGLLFAVVMTGIQFIIGMVFLVSIGGDRIKLFMQGGVLMWGWALSVFLAIGALVLLVMALMKPEKPKLLWIATGHMAGVLFGMSMGRDLLRQISLSEYFSVSELAIRPNYSSLIMFLVTFVIGLGTLAYMIRLVWNMPPKKDEAE